MPRDVMWKREFFSQPLPQTSFELAATNIQVAPGETLVRLRLWHRLVGVSASLVFDQFGDAALGVALLPFGRFPPSEPSFGPYQSPDISDTEPWLWWTRLAYDPWPYGASGVHFITPAASSDIDVKAQRAVPSTEPDVWRLWLWYQQADGLDWEVEGYFGASALIMEAPA